ncbi:hypothetical protein LBMAG42_53700 [Deltaproteobacteria bacterium]|nr:hypothetical protein LBMAG42_53700 [Deltaproteobacteria bacterium]
MKTLQPLLPLLSALALCGCFSTAGKTSDTAWWGDSARDADADTDADSDSDADDDGPSEEESDYLRLAPAATDQYVFVANPDRDTLTRVAVSTLEVRTVGVGRIPSTVQTTSDYRIAVTLDEGDDSVSYVYAETLDVQSVEIRDNMNQLSLAPNGEWAMAWYDPNAESLGVSGGITSFNEVSFVRTEPLVHYPLAVGYNPKGVRWSDDGRLAVVVSDGSLAVIDLAADSPSARLIPLVDDELDAPVAEEVILSADGAFAFVRQRGVQDLLVVDLSNEVVDALVVGTDPTDMDLSVDGERLSVVSRSARQVWTFDMANPYADPTVVDFPSDLAYGSLAFTGDGLRALLYTNASLISSLAIWDLGDDSFSERALVKPVASVGLSPEGDTALIFHSKDNADDANSDDPFYDEWAITLMETDGIGENRLLLPSEPAGYTVSDNNRWGFFIMEGQSAIEACSFSTLIPELVKLPSEPVFVGTLPGTDVAWASEQHDLGRLSFYDAAAGTLDTITGFELNSEIEH